MPRPQFDFSPAPPVFRQVDFLSNPGSDQYGFEDFGSEINGPSQRVIDLAGLDTVNTPPGLALVKDYVLWLEHDVLI